MACAYRLEIYDNDVRESQARNIGLEVAKAFAGEVTANPAQTNVHVVKGA